MNLRKFIKRLANDKTLPEWVVNNANHFLNSDSEKPYLTCQEILDYSADYFDMSVNQIINGGRWKDINDVRLMIRYAMHEFGNNSFQIADVMKIERSTVTNSIKRVNEFMQTEYGYLRKINKYIEYIESKI